MIADERVREILDHNDPYERGGFSGEIEELLEELLAIRARTRWIPCSERMPEDGALVMLLSAGGTTVGSWDPKFDMWAFREWKMSQELFQRGPELVTQFTPRFWMPLRDLPEVKA
jgi:hypothetical protein